MSRTAKNKAAAAPVAASPADDVDYEHVDPRTDAEIAAEQAEAKRSKAK